MQVFLSDADAAKIARALGDGVGTILEKLAVTVIRGLGLPQFDLVREEGRTFAIGTDSTKRVVVDLRATAPDGTPGKITYREVDPRTADSAPQKVKDEPINPLLQPDLQDVLARLRARQGHPPNA